MEQSILKSTKKMLGVGDDDDSFDHDIVTHINSVFSTLHQMGVGLSEGFAIEDDTPEWEDCLETDDPLLPHMGLIKTCVYLQVRLLFDPPTTPPHLGALQTQISEHQWRLSQARENTDWADPDPPEVPAGDIFDGGDADP